MPNITSLPPKSPPIDINSLIYLVDGSIDYKITLANLFTALSSGYSVDINTFLASASSRAAFDSLSKKGGDVVSAATVDLNTVTGNYVNITGTTTITAITLAEGKQRLVRFAGALTLTHGASLVLPNAANITTAAGDFALFVGDTGGVVRCAGYFRANTLAIAFRANLTADQVINNGVSTKLNYNTATINYLNWFNTGTSRLIPQKAGYYLVNNTVTAFDATGTIAFISSTIRKNGSQTAFFITNNSTPGFAITAAVSDIYYMNGTTDYLEFYVSGERITQPNFTVLSANDKTFFQATYLGN